MRSLGFVREFVRSSCHFNNTGPVTGLRPEQVDQAGHDHREGQRDSGAKGHTDIRLKLRADEAMVFAAAWEAVPKQPSSNQKNHNARS
jgi:hypothetical protein